MHKLIVKLSNSPSPLEPVIITGGLIEKEIYVKDIYDTESICEELVKLVCSIEGCDKGAVRVEVSSELPGIGLRGTVRGDSFDIGSYEEA